MVKPNPSSPSPIDKGQNESANNTGRVAIITVHGVGSQAPHVTACELAGLLQRANPNTYSEFSTAVLDLEVVKPALAVDRSAESRTKSDWYVRSRFARVKMAAARADAGDIDPGPIQQTDDSVEMTDDLAFTSSALAGVEIDTTLRRYQTRVLAGTRAHDGSSKKVDIYEMYWADLSHLGGWLGQVLGQFYQLLFHVASLGQKTVELAWANSKPPHRDRLTRVLIAQTIVEWLLAGALPIANLALLLAILPAAITLLPQNARDTLCGSICGALAGFSVIAILCYAIWKHTQRTGYLSSDSARTKIFAAVVLVVILLGVMVGIFTALWAGKFSLWGFTPSTLLFLVSSAICAAILIWFAHRFSMHRSDKYGGASISAPMMVLVASLLIWAIMLTTSPYEFATEGDAAIVFTTLRIGEGLFLLLQMSWTLLVLAAWAACAFGWWTLVKGAPGKIRAAIWTGKMALFIPATLFMLVTLLMWSAFLVVFKKTFSDIAGYESVYGDSAGLIHQLSGCGSTTALFECMDRLVELSASPGFNLFLIFVILVVVFAIIGLLPSLIRESRPASGAEAKAEAAESAAMGAWLDAGFVVLRIAGYINLFALLAILPMVQIAFWVPALREFKDVLGPFQGSSALLYMTGFIVGSAGILVLFRDFLFDGFGSALDIGLDVDNWLRERPIEENPRGRILSRYLSLLNHVSDPGNGYDRIVIVSHSQGTVISTDLLRFLKIAPHLVPHIVSRKLPITLFTFGSPLRQLYGLRFPDLYGWARASSVKPSVPDPAALGVEKWINGYRSGDYVGRYFWTTAQQWKPFAESARHPDGSWEFCVGAGSHTHYFDAAGTKVGKVIDRAIFQ